MEDIKFLDMELLIKRIHLSKSTIYKRVSKNTIPHFKLGRKTLFDIEQIDQWVLSGGKMENDLPSLPKL
jgi:excisionase family DNA binding protein